MELKPKEKTKKISTWRDSLSVHDAISEIKRETGAPYTDVMKLLIRLGINEHNKSKKPKKEPVPRSLPKCAHWPFEDFWQIYPKKVDKKDSKLAWAKISMDAELWDRIKAHVLVAYAHTDKQYVPSPYRYLKKELWTNEIIGQSKQKEKQGYVNENAEQYERLFGTKEDNGTPVHPVNGLVHTQMDIEDS